MVMKAVASMLVVLLFLGTVVERAQSVLILKSLLLARKREAVQSLLVPVPTDAIEEPVEPPPLATVPTPPLVGFIPEQVTTEGGGSGVS